MRKKCFFDQNPFPRYCFDTILFWTISEKIYTFWKHRNRRGFGSVELDFGWSLCWIFTKKRWILIGSLLLGFWKKKHCVDCLLGFCRNLSKVSVFSKKLIFLTKSEYFSKCRQTEDFSFGMKVFYPKLLHFSGVFSFASKIWSILHSISATQGNLWWNPK